ncbi:MAG: glycosyltransferase family 4 protein [Anaerohalosphaeraceae bacterium]
MSHSSDNPKLLFVCLELGQYSEIWMQRQLAGFRRLDPQILTWRNHLGRDDALASKIKCIDCASYPAANCVLRRVHKIQRWYERNWYGVIGRERVDIEDYVRDHSFKVILAHYGFAALRILPVGLKYKIPIFAHFHGYDLSSGLSEAAYKWSLLRSLNRFSGLVVVGSHQRKWLLEQGVPADKVHLIPCGVPTAEFSIKNYDTVPQAVRFVAVSRLVENKGLDYTLRAFALVHEKQPESSLHIYGDGPKKQMLIDLVNELGLGQHVFFYGAVSTEVVRQALHTADIFVQHSHRDSVGSHEGFGVTLAEAASVGLPVVATRCGGILDQVVEGVTGLLVDQRDFRAMAGKMLELAENSDLRHTMGLAGRARMVEWFDTQKQIEKLENLLVSAI